MSDPKVALIDSHCHYDMYHYVPQKERGGKRQAGEPSLRLVLVNQDPHR